MTQITKPSELSSSMHREMTKSLKAFFRMANANSRAHGFYDEYDEMLELIIWKIPEKSDLLTYKYVIDTKLSKIALIHSELGEMTEGVRKPGADQHCPEFTQEEVELADTLIRIFDYAEEFGLRAVEAVMAKMEYNANRPYKHGKGA